MNFRNDSKWPRAMALLGFCGWLLLATAATAQQPEDAAQVEGSDPAELQDLVDTLENDSQRAEFIQRLRALIEAKRELEGAAGSASEENLGADILVAISAQLSTIHNQARSALAVLDRFPEAISELSAIAQDSERRSIVFEAAAKVALIIAFGLFTEWSAKRLLARARRRRAQPPETGWQRHLLKALGLLLVNILPLLAFAAAAYGLLPFTNPREITQLVILAIVNANVLVRAVTAVARVAFSPDAGETRLLPMADETAQYWVIWTRRLSGLVIYGYFFIEAALLLGLAVGAHRFFLKVLVFIVLGLAVVLISQNRSNVAALISHQESDLPARKESLIRRTFADTWHLFAVVFVVVLYAVWLFEVEGGFQYLLRSGLLSLVVIVIARLLLMGLRRAVHRGFSLREDLKLRYPGLERRANQYLANAQGALKLVIQGIAVLFVLEVWGIDIFGWVASDTGSTIVARLASLLLVFLGAYLLWEVTSFFIERYLERRDLSGTEVLRSSRTRTLLPLLRNTVRIVLVVMVTLTIFSEFGIDIAPLLAGAGVVGLAIGFGAQSLVKDVITGVFILLEDALAVGDYVDLGGHMGTVESLTIRSVTLRDLDGNVHVVPFGEVSAVLNMAKEFGISLIDVGIAYRENVDHVIEVLKEIGEELRLDETWGPHIIGLYEVLGLHRFEDSAVVIRTRFKTKPMMQWAVRREFYLRMKRVFDARGIEIPFPHQTIYFGVDKDGMAPGITVKQEPAG